MSHFGQRGRNMEESLRRTQGRIAPGIQFDARRRVLASRNRRRTARRTKPDIRGPSTLSNQRDGRLSLMVRMCVTYQLSCTQISTLYIHLSVCLSTCRSLSVCLSVSICLSVSVCLPVDLCLSACRSVVPCL